MKKALLFFSMSGLLFVSACAQEEGEVRREESKSEGKEQKEIKYTEPHSYGGWYCPDNFGGFPPVSISELDNVPVVKDRLPTKEETRDGRSLIFVDTEKYPDARILEMELPSVARYQSHYANLDELIIVIQAVIIGQDTIVGFRYPNGGNGSARYGEVDFLSDQEVDALGSTPFVYIKEEIKAPKNEVWEAFTQTDYAQFLSSKFNKKHLFASPWSDDNSARLSSFSVLEEATGVLTMVFGNLYMHIDYIIGDQHYSEKMLFLEDREHQTTQVHFVSGPFPDDYQLNHDKWEKWIEEIKNIIEEE